MDSSDVWVNILIPLLLSQLFLYIKSVYDNYISHVNQKKKIIFDEKLSDLKNKLQFYYWPIYIKLLCIYQLNYNIPIKNSYEYISSDSESDFDNNDVVTKKCNNIYNKNGKRIHCKSNIPINSNNICKKCRWRNENINKDSDSIDSRDSNDSIEDKELKLEDETFEISIPIQIDNEDSKETLLEDFELQTILIDKSTVQNMERSLNILYEEVLEIFEKNMYNIGSCDRINKTIILFIKYCKIRNIISDGSITQKYNPNYFGVKNNTNKLLSIIEKHVIKYQKDYYTLLENGPFV